MTYYGRETLGEYLAARIDFDAPGGCWVWTGSLVSRPGNPQDRYGAARHRHLDGRGMVAHRAVWLRYVGPIEDGLHLDHLCRVRRCVNPDHLEPVTQAENNRRAALAVTHCPQGHAYNTANTYLDARGYRKCRRCRADRERVRYQKRLLERCRELGIDTKRGAA